MSTDTLTSQAPINARQAEAYIPKIEEIVGNREARTYFLRRLSHDPEGDANVLLIGVPGTCKTNLILSYLRERFHNPLFNDGDVEEVRGDEDQYRTALESKANQIVSKTDYDIRLFQTNIPGRIYAYVRIDGASDSLKTIELKVRDAMNNSADHTFVFLDEAGELYFRGLEEMLRPVMTALDITTYATAQNLHSKRKTDTAREEDDRIRAFLRRFSRVFDTELPNEEDFLCFLARRIHAWGLKLDHPDTLRLLWAKSGGVVGYALRSLVTAIDEDDRRLTRSQVSKDDPDPINH
jgi:hypothetical protein